MELAQPATMPAHVTAAYAQLLSVGVLWITIHCAGMCGPLVLGLNLGGGRRPGDGLGVARGVAHVLAYQGGKATAYALFGAAAGLLGHAVATVLPVITPYLSAVLGLVMLAWGLLPRRKEALVGLGTTSALQRWVSRMGLVLAQSTALRSFSLGALLSVLPCAVVAWALALAASTQHPLHGAAVMVLLAVMTSVPLTVVGALPALLGPKVGVAVRGMQRVLLPLSGAWLVLVSAAALGLVPHASVAFRVAGRSFMLMFF